MTNPTPIQIELPPSDKVLWNLFQLSSEDEQVFEVQRQKLERTKEHFLHDMSIIDAKSSALLTHVSIMLAVIAVVLGQQNDALWKWVFTTELALFSLVAVLLLRCVDIMGPPRRTIALQGVDAIITLYRSEILLRRAIYQQMMRVVRLLTIGVILAVLIKAAG